MMVERDERALIGELVRRMNESSIRIKDLESRIGRIERDFASISEDMSKKMGEFRVELKKISEFSENLAKINVELVKVKGELENFATKGEMKEFEKFIELISPITSQFITRDELERILEEKFRGKF